MVLERWRAAIGVACLVACGGHDAAPPPPPPARDVSPARSELVAVIDPPPLGASAGVLGEPRRVGASMLIHDRPILGLAVTPDGKTAYAAGLPVDELDPEHAKPEHGVRVWDLMTSTQRATIGNAIARTFAATPDASRIAVVDITGELHVWDRDGVPQGHATVGTTVRWLGLDGSGAIAYTVDLSGVVASWDVRDGKQRGAIAMHVEATRAAGTARGTIAIGTNSGEIELVDGNASASVRQLPKIVSFVTGLAFSKDGTRLIALGEGDGAIYDVAAGTSVRIGVGGQQATFLSDGKRVVVSGPTQGQQLQLVDIASGTAKIVDGWHGHALALAESPTGAVIAGTWQGAIRTYDLTTFNSTYDEIKVLGIANDASVFTDALAVAPSGTTARYTDDKLSIRGGGRSLQLPMDEPDHVALDDRFVVTVSTVNGDGPGQQRSHVHAFDLAAPVDHAWDAGMFVQAVALSPDDQLVALGGDNVELFVRATGKRVRTLLHDTVNVAAMSFTPDGAQLIVASESDGVQIFETATGVVIGGLVPGERGKPQGSGNTAYALAITNDGARFATGHRDGTVNVWDRAGKRIASARRHHALVAAMAFSRDGSMLATADQIRQTWLWPIAK